MPKKDLFWNILTIVSVVVGAGVILLLIVIAIGIIFFGPSLNQEGVVQKQYVVEAATNDGSAKLIYTADHYKNYCIDLHCDSAITTYQGDIVVEIGGVHYDLGRYDIRSNLFTDSRRIQQSDNIFASFGYDEVDEVKVYLNRKEHYILAHAFGYTPKVYVNGSKEASYKFPPNQYQKRYNEYEKYWLYEFGGKNVDVKSGTKKEIEYTLAARGWEDIFMSGGLTQLEDLQITSKISDYEDK